MNKTIPPRSFPALGSTRAFFALLALMLVAAVVLSACAPPQIPAQSPPGQGSYADPTTPPPADVAADDASTSETASTVTGGDAVQESSSQDAQDEALTTQTGTLSIITHPLNAEVYIDGAFVGMSPIVVLNVTYGSHLILAAKPTYVNNTLSTVLDQERAYAEINLTDQATYDKIESMKDQPGDVSITSNPGNAKVSVDGNAVGTTPLTLRALAPGNHTLEITKDTYLPYDGSFEIRGGQLVRYDITLTEIRTPVLPGDTTT